MVQIVTRTFTQTNMTNRTSKVRLPSPSRPSHTALSTTTTKAAVLTSPLGQLKRLYMDKAVSTYGERLRLTDCQRTANGTSGTEVVAQEWRRADLNAKTSIAGCGKSGGWNAQRLFAMYNQWALTVATSRKCQKIRSHHCRDLLLMA